jgi:pyruvate formate lyase activating enzyme
MTVDAVMKEIERDLVFFDESGGGVTFSGGEPLAQPEFLLRLLHDCQRRGIHRAVDTSGHAEAAILDRVAGETDLFLYDLKLIDPKRHERFTGVSNDLILRNLDALCKGKASVLVRFPLIPGVNDDEECIRDLGRLLSRLALPVELLPYHRAGMQKYARLGRDCPMRDAAPPSEEMKARAAGLLKAFGLKVLLEGESHDPE